MLKLIKNYLWPFFLILFLIGSGLFIYGVVQSFQIVSGETSPAGNGEGVIGDENGNGVSNLEPDEDDGDSVDDINDEGIAPGTLSFITLGDSLGRGTGDEEGLGFSGRSVDMLREILDTEIRYSNFAVDGFRSREFAELFGSEEFLQEISNADGVFLSIGGNDLRTLQNLSPTEQEEAYESMENAYLEILEETFALLRSENPEALVVFLGLYHLDYTDEGSVETDLLLRWNASTSRLISRQSNAVWIPTYDLFQFQWESFLSFDGLHPNSEGYQRIAERIVDVITPFFSGQ